MKLCGVDTVDIEPGDVHRWELSASAPSEPVAVPPSENEKFHLDAVRRHRAAGWLALALEFDEAVAVDDLTDALRALIDRHEVLRCHFVADGEEYHRHCVPAGTVTVTPVPAAPPTGGAAGRLAEGLLAEIATACSPFTPLHHFFVAVRRPTSTTLIVAFDHCYVDAYSLAVIAADLADDLAGTPVAQPASYLDIRTIEESAPVVAADDPRLGAWGEFLAANDWAVPEFPLDLGLARGETADVHTDIRTLMCTASARRFERAVHAVNARTYPALLTAVADAVHDAGGPAELATILPVHTRWGADDRRTVGWLVGNAPIRLSARAAVGTALRTNSTRLGEALPLARIGLTPVYRTYADLIRANRNDVFMVSYVDYRKLGLPEHISTRQISSSRETDGAQFWFWRDLDGIHVRTRYPDTPVAHRTMRRVLAALDARVHHIHAAEPRHRAG
ncbi:condensation protein [Gordonia insulae]|uniref:SL659 acyltransferase papA1 n=1 Tax=Gordonia insulae TaxID=2420509 RepID=A0A3G8JJY4_9ACTN|nr:condensation protein [Gordonia insulae]AZG44842.1 SL659 acyltransferase papA1 [Gordonia insulae]